MDFIKGPCGVYWDDHVAFLPLVLWMWSVNLIDCCSLSHPCISRTNSPLAIMYEPFHVLLNPLASILLMMFMSVFISSIDLQFSFFVKSVFAIMVVSFIKWVWKCCLLLNFLKVWGLALAFKKYLLKFTRKSSRSMASLCWKVFEYRLNFFMNYKFAQILFLHCSVSVDCVFLGVYSVFLG